MQEGRLFHQELHRQELWAKEVHLVLLALSQVAWAVAVDQRSLASVVLEADEKQSVRVEEEAHQMMVTAEVAEDPMS